MRILLVTHYYPQRWGPHSTGGMLSLTDSSPPGTEVAVLAPWSHYPAEGAYRDQRVQRRRAFGVGRHGESIHRLRFLEPGHRISARVVDHVVMATHAVLRGARVFVGHRRPDVIIAMAPGLPSIPAGMALRRLTGAPLVMEMRDAWPDILVHHKEWDDHLDGDARAERCVGIESRAKTRVVALARGRITAAVHARQRGADALVTITDSIAEVLTERSTTPVSTTRNPAPNRTSRWPLPTPSATPQTLKGSLPRHGEPKPGSGGRHPGRR